MTSTALLAHQTINIESCAKPAYYAFFDVDGTIINLKSMVSFLDFLRADANLSTQIRHKCYQLSARWLEKCGASREFLNKYYYRQFKHDNVDLVMSKGRAWFAKLIKENKDLFFPDILKEIKRHQANHAEIVFVSGSFEACLRPLAELLQVKHLLATSLDIRAGFYTGNILAPQLIGKGKAQAVVSFLQKYHDENHAACFGYGDHHSDFPMLEVIGNAFVVTIHGALKKYENKFSSN